MALTVGTRLGFYEVTAQIGEGGMGEVYRATDTKLKRQVAIKILPPGLATDHDRLARFQREAEVLAALNHPNIAGIYGIEESGGSRALIMELVEGEDLSQRIARGALPLDEALPIAKQIAEALEAAHERGIIHRDLKPANIKVRPDGTVKVLDFGLAKAMEPAGASSADAMNAPTLTARATQAGVILGTAAYMAPEQARGKPVDERVDIWAFGVVLYEMLTGRRLFAGEDLAETLAAVVKEQPDLSGAPRSVQRLLRKCLEKDPKRRLRDIGDAWELLDNADVGERPKQPSVRLRPASLAGVLLAAAALGAMAAWYAGRPDVRPIEVSQFVDELPETASQLIGDRSSVAISRDGRTVVYQVLEAGLGYRLIRRFIGRELQGKPIGDVGASEPFFSPDGEWVGFGVGGALRKVSVGGGTSEPIATLPNLFRGGSWTADGTILLGCGAAGLQRVSERGEVTTLLKPSDGREIFWPQLLPGERTVLYTERASAPSPADELMVLDLGTGRTKPLLQGFAGRYVSSGHLVFLQDNDLWAVAFDLRRLEVRGTPKIVREDVRGKGPAGTFMGTAVADNAGTLVYALPSGAPQLSLVWRNRNGVDQPVADSPARAYANPRLSPDGKLIAVSIREESAHIWTWDIERRHLSQLTSDAKPNMIAAWFPDSKRLAFSYVTDRGTDGYWQAADGSGVPTPLSERSAVKGLGFPVVVSKAGVVFQGSASGVAGGQNDLSLLPLGDRKTQEPLLQTSANELNPDVSPDGRWLAFESDRQVVVRPFPNVQDGGWTITNGRGGLAPRWSPDGTELFYWKQEDTTVAIMAVPVAMQPSFHVTGDARELFRGAYAQGSWDRNYDVARDGRFLLMKKTTGSPRDRIAIVTNWFEELKRLVPVK